MPLRRVTPAALLAALALVGVPRDADACCMVPAGWDGDVDQAEQNVVVLHHDGHEELVLRVQPFFQTRDGQPLADAPDATPPYLEWVVTVPDTPTGYRTVPATVFRDADGLVDALARLAEAQYRARSRWEWPSLGGSAGVDSAAPTASASLSAAHGLDVAAPVAVGPYEITAVKARGREALDALNAYLAGRGFPQEDPDHMAWFVDRGFTFLCIHVTPPAGAKTLGRRLDLEPLQIGFATPRPYYPAKFSSRQGAFAVSLATVTSRPIARASRRDVNLRLAARGTTYANLWTSKPLPAALGDAATGAWAAGASRWHLNAFRSDGFNFLDKDRRPAIASWTDDVFFDLGGDDDEMPDWYYGDRDLGAPERLWREHRVAGAVWTGLAAVVVLGLRTRARARKARRPT